MQLITHTKPHILIADEGYELRNREDIYKPATEEEPEYIPYVFTVAFVPDEMTLEDCQSKYIEE
jgi:hypothetical protein